MGLSLVSALILRLFAASWRLFALMYSYIFFVTSVRGIASLPMIAASSVDGVNGLLKPVAAGDFFAAVAMDSPIWLV